jgi:hypothetical protein
MPRHAAAASCAVVPWLLWLLLTLLLVVQSLHVDAQCDSCVAAVSSSGCPFPELCGLGSIACVNCSTAPRSPSCPQPAWCLNVTCVGCMDGMPMPGCRDPAACGLLPTPCTGCRVGQSRAGCPQPADCTACSDPQRCPQHDSPPCWRCRVRQERDRLSTRSAQRPTRD